MRMRRIKEVVAESEDEGSRLSVRYENRGEPYREGLTVELHLTSQEGWEPAFASVFLDKHEVKKMRDALDEALKGEHE